MNVVRVEVVSVGGMDKPPAPCKRNLGSAIVETAIHDYRSTAPGVYEHAREFLYPRTEEARNHLDWVMALAPGVDAGWLRDMLDRRRSRWDAQRMRTKGRAQ